MRFLISAGLLATALTTSALANPAAIHTMPMHPSAQARAASTIEYFGGPVIAQVNVITVFWGAGQAAATLSGIGPFLQSLAGSTYQSQLDQYSTAGLTGVSGHAGSNQTISTGTYGGQFTITPANKSLRLTDKAIQKELLAQIAAGHLPKQSLNNLYMIYFPANITISLGGSTSCVAFGAYHSATSATATPGNVFYGVMPACSGGFTFLTLASSHEFAEAVSDAIPTPGSHPKYPQAWNTSGGSEIGDLCEGNNTTLTTGTKTYTVQEVFDKATNACATGTFTAP